MPVSGWRMVLAVSAGLPVLPAKAAPWPAPFDTGLSGAVAPATGTDERIVVQGARRAAAPVPGYEESAPPWEAGRAIRDARTGTSTTAFGNAFNLGDPMGSDERSNETGGALVAPRHQ